MDFVSFTAEEVFSILDILKVIFMIQDTIAWLKVSHPKEGCGGFDNKPAI